MNNLRLEKSLKNNIEINTPNFWDNIKRFAIHTSLILLTQITPVIAKEKSSGVVFDEQINSPIEFVVNQSVSQDTYRPSEEESTFTALTDIFIKRLEVNNLGKLNFNLSVYHRVASDQAKVVVKQLQSQGITNPSKKRYLQTSW
ncbi:MAG: hypothetical protein HC932_01265 [Thermales bacterium]|nr:hypothetical protein [Thermales bacterium]